MTIHSITSKAWLFSALFAVLLACQFFFQYNAQLKIKNQLTILQDTHIPMLEKAESLKFNALGLSSNFSKIKLSSDSQYQAELAYKTKVNANKFAEAFHSLNALFGNKHTEFDFLLPQFKEYLNAGNAMSRAFQNGNTDKGRQLLEIFELNEQKLMTTLDRLLLETKKTVDEDIELDIIATDSELNLLIGFSLCFSLLLISLMLAIKHILSNPMSELSLIIQKMTQQQIESGSISINTETLNKNPKTELGLIGFNLNELLSAINENFKKTLDIANHNKRIKDALNACSTNVMVADAEYTIVYMNPAVQKMMRLAEADLKEALPHFQAKGLVGKNIDIFHAKPEHQRQLLDKLSSTYKAHIHVGKRTFCLIATPIFSEDNTRIGTVVEWDDKTTEAHIEREVSELIIAANRGDLSQRINSDGQSEFVDTLAKGLNELLDKVSGFVEDVGSLFHAMSEGDLRKRITNTYQGELEDIRNNANSSVSKLDEALVRIRNASDIVNISSYEVAQGADDLSQRTESQASSLEETASSMVEITETVKHTAESATISNTLANEAIQKAQKGGNVVHGAVHAMSDIKGASNKINDIIGVIDEIAFQTNLLALNAAVEAARAGEQGRGFAVVAAEVRNLSQRSASAAKEIKELIRDSVTKVESGAKLVNESGLMLSEIVEAVEKVAKMIGDVTSAAIEQNEGIKQINKAVTLMDEMTQKNAALVEETSAASRSMSDEASSMSQSISFFNLSQMPEIKKLPSSTSPKTTSSPSSGSPDNIKTYTPNKLEQKPFSTTKGTGNNGAASFSNDDDWEDF